MERLGSNFGGGGQFSLLGHAHVPSSFGEHGSKSNCSSLIISDGLWITLLTGMDPRSMSAAPISGNLLLIIPSFSQASFDSNILSTPSAT